jgi:hypothetical protein
MRARGNIVITNRRTSVPFDPFHFAQEAAAGRRYSAEETFRMIYRTNHWGAAERSGAGAAVDQAAVVLSALASMIEQLPVRTLLDVPCGDFAWMQHLKADVQYIGGDVLPELAATNRKRFDRPDRQFVTLDLMKDDLPDADLLLCRDCLVHLSFEDARSALANIRRSRIRWLLTTTFPGCASNEDIVTGDWRPLNLQLAPFNLPAPDLLINEQCTEGGNLFADKSLGLWRL